MQVDPDAFFAQLEQDGEDVVRKRLASNAVYGGDKKGLVEEWLHRKDQERQDSLNAEHLKIARDAADSAGVSADEAKRANRHATWANRISFAAVVIAVVSLIISLFSISN